MHAEQSKQAHGENEAVICQDIAKNDQPSRGLGPFKVQESQKKNEKSRQADDGYVRSNEHGHGQLRQKDVETEQYEPLPQSNSSGAAEVPGWVEDERRLAGFL